MYLSLLESPNCPDRDIVLNNCATIFYEEKLYLNALSNFNQIADELTLSYNNIAVTYLNLHEHYMANRFILRAAEDSLDVIENYNKSIFNWVYSFDSEEGHPQILGDKFKNQSDLAMLNRLEYGKMLIEVLTAKMGAPSPGQEFQEFKQNIENIMSQDLVSLVDPSQKEKVKALVSVISKPFPKTSDTIDLNLLTICLTHSENPEKDFNNLIKQCMEMSQLSQNVFESLLNIFIFVNR